MALVVLRNHQADEERVDVHKVFIPLTALFLSLSQIPAITKTKRKKNAIKKFHLLILIFCFVEVKTSKHLFIKTSQRLLCVNYLMALAQSAV